MVEIWIRPVVKFLDHGYSVLPAREREEVDRLWMAAVRDNPELFDGPVVVCRNLEDSGGYVSISWLRASYRTFALRYTDSPLRHVSSIFASVIQPVVGGGLVVGRMSSRTAHAGSWLLPGGSVEPPDDATTFNLPYVATEASRELAEEVGIVVPSEKLRMFALTRGEFGNIGFHFVAPTVSRSVLSSAFESVILIADSSDHSAEFREVHVINRFSDVEELQGKHPDYLPLVVRAYFDLCEMPAT